MLFLIVFYVQPQITEQKEIVELMSLYYSSSCFNLIPIKPENPPRRE